MVAVGAVHPDALKERHNMTQPNSGDHGLKDKKRTAKEGESCVGRFADFFVTKLPSPNDINLKKFVVGYGVAGVFTAFVMLYFINDPWVISIVAATVATCAGLGFGTEDHSVQAKHKVVKKANSAHWIPNSTDKIKTQIIKR